MTKLFGYGIVSWVVAFMAASIFVAFGSYSGIFMTIVTTGAMLLTVYLLAKSLNISSRKALLKYGFVWALTALLLDLIVTARFTGNEFFYSWQIWVSYALIVFVPTLAPKKA